MNSSAVLSDCGTYRYRLDRWWGDGPRVAFVMLNPSTADAAVDDPTIRRCIGFARSWGFDGLTVVNLYALRATDPKELRQHPRPGGPDNVEHVMGVIDTAGLVVTAWGSHAMAERVSGRIHRWAEAHERPLHHLGLTKSGAPRHPLYLRRDVTPTRFPVPARALPGGGGDDD